MASNPIPTTPGQHDKLHVNVKTCMGTTICVRASEEKKKAKERQRETRLFRPRFPLFLLHAVSSSCPSFEPLADRMQSAAITLLRHQTKLNATIEKEKIDKGKTLRKTKADCIHLPDSPVSRSGASGPHLRLVAAPQAPKSSLHMALVYKIAPTLPQCLISALCVLFSSSSPTLFARIVLLSAHLPLPLSRAPGENHNWRPDVERGKRGAKRRL